MPELTTYQKYAIAFGLPIEDIAYADYNIFTNTLTVTYGIDQPRYKQKKVVRKAIKEFADFFTAPIFIGKNVDDILSAYLKEKGGVHTVRESQGISKIYYTSTDPVFGKMTMRHFIETEVEERGNYTLAEVQNWMRKYGLSMDDLAIWVSPKKWVANRYNLLAEEWDEAKNIPESEMDVSEIKGSEGFIIPESDDGDDGYLFVFKKSREASKYTIREGGTPVPDSVNIVSKIIQEINEKPWTVPEKRAEIVARLNSASSEIDRKIITEIRSFRPMGVIPEFGAAMGVKPRKGVRIDTLMGATVFDEKRMPSKERIDRWDAEHKEAERIREIVPEFAFSIQPRPNTVTGNYRIVEHGERLKAQGLLAPEEEKILEALEKYWQEHPEFDRMKGYGIWGYNLDIMVPEGLRKDMTEKKESLIDALLKIEPGKYIIIDYKDVPKDVDMVSLPPNLRGIVVERKGDFLVAAIQSDRDIVAYLYVQKGSQLIQIRPIPRQKTPTKEGEVNTIEYNMWVERIKKEAPEYLPEWEKVPKQPWEMTRSEAIAVASKPLGPMGISWGEMRTALSTGRKYAESMHKDMVKLAIVEKKPVPHEVLNEYPDLTAKTKEQWEMTRDEFERQEWFQRIYGSLTGANRESALGMHKEAILEALKAGKPVPPEVLKEYPDLKNRGVPEIFTYYFRNRPPDIGTYPQGAVTKEAWLPTRKTPKGNMAFGWVKYERELTPDEIKNYELFVDEIVMPKLVAELIKFTHDEGINEGFNVLKSKTGWSEYGLAFRDWLKANNEWKPDKGEEAEFLRHMARLAGIKNPEQKQETPDQLYAKLFSEYNPQSKGAQAQVSDKDMISFISTELKIPPEQASKLSWIFKQKLQDEYNAWKANEDAIRAGKLAEEEKQAKAMGLQFWDEVKNLKVMDFEVEHDINPDKPTRTYYHVYDRTFAILENGKKVQVSYVIYKGEEGKCALKATKEFYASIYGQYMGKPLSEWITYDQLMSGNSYESYKAQQPKTRFTFIPEAPPAGVIVGGTPARQILTVTQPETYYFGTQIEVMRGADPELDPYFTGTIKRLLNNGELVEVHPEGEPREVSFRVPVDRVNVIRLVTQVPPAEKPKVVIENPFGIDLSKSIVPYPEAPKKVSLEDMVIEIKEIRNEMQRLGIKRTGSPDADVLISRENQLHDAIRDIYLGRLDKIPESRQIQPEGLGILALAGRATTKAVLESPSKVNLKEMVSEWLKGQDVIARIQAARSVEELQPIMKEISFLPITELDKNTLIGRYRNRYSELMAQTPFGVPVKNREEKPKVLGAPTPQQLFEAEQRRKAAESRKISAAPTLTSGAVTARRLEMFEPGAMEKAKAQIEARKRIEQLGLPYDVHPYVRKLAAGTQDVMKFGSKRGKETVEDLVLMRYVRYCPPGTIIDNRNVPKVPERWWVYPTKLRACMGEIEKKLAEAGAGMVKEGYSQRYRYSIYHDRRLFANEDDHTEANGIYDMLVRTYPKSAVELRENFVHPRIHQRTLKQYPVPKEIYVVREATQLTPSMRSYIQGAQVVRDVIHYYRDNRTPTRGVLYRAKDGTYFVEAEDGQVYSAMGWEDVSQARMAPACRAKA